ncbi:hypothetical protein IAU59_002448 [Kwoniella sp. CBS 9459]
MTFSNRWKGKKTAKKTSGFFAAPPSLATPAAVAGSSRPSMPPPMGLPPSLGTSRPEAAPTWGMPPTLATDGKRASSPTEAADRDERRGEGAKRQKVMIPEKEKTVLVFVEEEVERCRYVSIQAAEHRRSSSFMLLPLQDHRLAVEAWRDAKVRGAEWAVVNDLATNMRAKAIRLAAAQLYKDEKT